MTRRDGTLRAGALAALGLAASSAQAFTEDQAASGQGQYTAQCAQCHGTRLQGVNAPALSDETMQNFSTAAGLHAMVSVSMPPQDPGGLDEETYLEIISYILQFNGAAADGEELTSDPDQLAAIDLVAITSAGRDAADMSLEPSGVDTAATGADPVPQAYTWGTDLPGGEAVATETTAAADAGASTVPQAYTWGTDLPSVD